VRILFAYRDDIAAGGGAASVMGQTAAALRELDHDVQIAYEVEPDVSGFDVVHAWNIWFPGSALAQLRYLRATGVPVVWQPFYLHWTEFAWANAAVRQVFAPQRDEGERARLLDAMADGTLAVGALQRHLPNEIVPGLHEMLREMLGLVDRVCACSAREMQTLMQITRTTHKPWTLTRHGVDAAMFGTATPEPFVERYGVEDYVLCVGSLDGRKNQLMLVEALRGSGTPLVLIGPSYEPDYLALCRSRMGDEAMWIDRLPRELVASAYRGAAVHALPSFAEGSALASMEAAAGGCPVVVGNRTSELEYYGDLATYCDPADRASIREAVEVAVARGRDAAYREAPSAHITGFTWEAAARATLDAYGRLATDRPSRARAALGIEGTRARAIFAFAREIVESPDLLAGYAAAVTDGDDVTLVIGMPPGAGELEERLVEVAQAAGVDRAGGPDVLAVEIADPSPGLLCHAVDAVLSRRELPETLRGLTRINGEDARALRAFAAGA
jgi:glycosyltransferase involved in cell wall biosynthesis